MQKLWQLEIFVENFTCSVDGRHFTFHSHLLMVVLSVHFGGVKSQPFTASVGLRQGCVLSPFFFFYTKWIHSRGWVDEGVCRKLQTVAYEPGGRPPPRLEKFRANSVYRASSSC